jgi:phosphohistidine phosphatase
MPSAAAKQLIPDGHRFAGVTQLLVANMLLYLMRHGIAEDRSITGGDAGRELTQRGTLRTAMVAKGLDKLGIHFDRIICSPYVRARQTAEIVARITRCESDIVHDERLVPQAQLEDVSDLIRENDDVDTLLLTGHEPSMSTFISGLCADGHLVIEVKKASVTAIDIQRFRPLAAGTLLWALPPKVFEGISR